jgi:predicted transposase YdaD
MDNIMVQNDVLDTARDEGRAEGLAEGRAEGRAEGLEEGRAEERKKLIRSMHEKGLDDETIAGVTNTPVDIIRQILLAD